MTHLSRFLLVLGTALLCRLAAAGAGPAPAELTQRDQWMWRHLQNAHQPQPFSFIYGGRSSEQLLLVWPHTRSIRDLDADRVQEEWTWRDPATGLEVRNVSVRYRDYPVVEWTAHFRNTGDQPTQILEQVQGLNTVFERGLRGEFLLRGIKGDSCTADSYEPYEATLGPGVLRRFAPPGHSGKSCDGPEGWPYFNLQHAAGGMILAVGWPGQWSAAFERDLDRSLRIRAGQERTHLKLNPGEEIRTPLIALLFWRGEDWVRAQNLWRRWYLAHNLPRIGGQPQAPLSQIQVDAGVDNIAYVKTFLEAGIRADVCWRDAGGAHTWYPNQTGPYHGNDSWLNTGTWEIDRTRYPKGFRPFSDWARSKGMQFLLWFEPERVGDPQSTLAREHPAWLLPGSSHGSILNLGNPEALRWLTDHVDAMIQTEGLDWYREDMNGAGPLPAWRKADAPDREGWTENRYIQGHLAFWDELRRRHPGLHIDSCASGGRRNDLESMRRAVPLLRSDFQFPEMPGVVEGNQAHTYGLSFWLPYQGTGCYLHDLYAMRSFYLPAFGMGGLSKENTAAQKQAYRESSRIAPLMFGDYHPLTPYSRSTNNWIAWQFHRNPQGDGLVQLFRRAGCRENGITVLLKDLDPNAHYEVSDFDATEPRVFSGRDLMNPGLRVERSQTPAAAIYTYRRLP